MRLFHFSDDPGISLFVPRPVRTPSPRPPGRAWLNGPLVWAIDEARQPMYLFPRDCPRVLLWPLPGTTRADRNLWLGDAPMIACIERAWEGEVRRGHIHRYDLPPESFEDLDDAGMFVSRVPVVPRAVETIADLPAALAAQGVELRVMENLAPLRAAFASTLHASGIRLRNAASWQPPPAP